MKKGIYLILFLSLLLVQCENRFQSEAKNNIVKINNYYKEFFAIVQSTSMSELIENSKSTGYYKENLNWKGNAILTIKTTTHLIVFYSDIVEMFIDDKQVSKVYKELQQTNEELVRYKNKMDEMIGDMTFDEFKNMPEIEQIKEKYDLYMEVYYEKLY